MRLIDADALSKGLAEAQDGVRRDYLSLTDYRDKEVCKGELGTYAKVRRMVEDAPTISPDSLRPKGLYTAHEVAEIIAELFGDCCACNFNGIDEWLSEKCELGDACPNPVGVACWEQYLKHKDNCGADMRGEKT